jgi:hypothetical protein
MSKSLATAKMAEEAHQAEGQSSMKEKATKL